MEIVRTDTLFGSKKNIVGSTSADLVLETLGKVYIKTGKSTRTLTEILSEYSKTGNSSKESINSEELSKLLSEEYITNLIEQVLLKKGILGEYVPLRLVKDKGNYALPVYFNTKGEAQTISELNVKNKIETQDIVYGKKGVVTKGMCDLTIIGGYRQEIERLEGLIEALEERVAELEEEILE